MKSANLEKNNYITDGYKNSRFDPSASVFVAANAGSGKTSQLTNRVLALLLCGVEPGKILCLTFTNAAVAEMRSRVLRELGAWVMMEDEALKKAIARILGYEPSRDTLVRARAMFAEVLDAPEGVRIQTIHGFCQSLLARFPIEAGVNQHFAIMDKRTANEMLAEAQLRLFSSEVLPAPHAAAIRTLASKMRAEAFGDLLKAIVEHRFEFRDALYRPGGSEAAAVALWRHFNLPPELTLAELIAAHFDYDSKTAEALRAIATRLLAGKKTDKDRGETLAAWLTNPAGREAMVENYMSAFLTTEYEPIKRLSTQQTLTDEQAAQLLAEQQRVVAFNDRRRALDIAMLSAAVLRVAEATLALYDSAKRLHARMDHDDLILAARDLLQRPGISPWVLYKLDGGIDHVLVDEAQDTSPEQWQIVKALTDDFFAGQSRSAAERSLFIVGDEKQSIYSFQGADVKQLHATHQWFDRRIKEAGKTMLTHTLAHSFRSVPEVLKAVDAVFALPEARAGVISGSEALAHEARREQVSGVVELWPLVEPSEEYISSKGKLARMLADTIAGWIKEGRWRAGDIMVLVQTRTSFMHMLVRALKRKQVPVAGVDRMMLMENLAVQDLVALGKCLLLPDDNLTLAAWLKSPMGGVDEQTLFELCYNRGEASVWQRLRQRAHPAYEWLADLRKRADYDLPYELYAHALDTLRMRARILGRMGEEYAEAIDEFLSQALLYQRENTPSLQGFIHWLESGDSEIKRDMEQTQDAVRIMTVHGAKGLQAPVVILPDTLKTPQAPKPPLWIEVDGTKLPLWVKNRESDSALTRQERDAIKQAQQEEQRRLLYVAMTRAEDALYICGALGKKEKLPEGCWYDLISRALSPLGAACDTPAGEGHRIGQWQPRADAKSANIKSDAAYTGDLSYLTRPAPVDPVPPKPLAPSRGPDEPAASSPLNEQVFARGLFIHLLLQHLPSQTKERRLALAQSLAAPYRLQLDAKEIENCITEALSVIEHPSFAAIFSEHALAEVPAAGTVTMRGAPFVVSGQIDRLSIGEHDVWIVDYKTNRLPPDHSKSAPEAYLQQMATYRELLRRIYPQKKVHCALLWTAAPRMDVLDEAVLESYI